MNPSAARKPDSFLSAGQEQERSHSAVPPERSAARQGGPARSQPVPSSRGQKAADTHRRARWGYSRMDSQSRHSVDIFCAPDWCKGSSLSPLQPLPHRGRVSQNHCQTGDLMGGRESRGLGGGSASLSPSLRDHKPQRHKIPFKQQ